ncbi:hypothetical protein BK146_27320 [Paenibacillus sp. FSL R7-0333]|nr:hypothetical protein BK146_27320 [Paenibacillus sp. FSL R7-0333]
MVVKPGMLGQARLEVECRVVKRECQLAKYLERERVLMVHGVMGSARLEVERGETEREYQVVECSGKERERQVAE